MAECSSLSEHGLTWLEYRSIVSAIPTYWKEMLESDLLCEPNVRKYMFVRDSAKVSRWAYENLITTDQTLLQVCSFWAKMLPGNGRNVADYRKMCKNMRVLTKRVKLRDFQYRLIHNKIFCNNVLVHWKKVPSSVCDFCGTQKQTIVHLMYNCTQIRPIWMQLWACLRREKIECEFSIDGIIFNQVHPDPMHITNLLVLICKQFIYRCKCQGVTVKYKAVVMEITNNFRIDEYNHGKSVHKRWQPVFSCFKLDRFVKSIG